MFNTCQSNSTTSKIKKKSTIQKPDKNKTKKIQEDKKKPIMLRNVKLSLFDDFVNNPFLARCKNVLIACENHFPDKGPGLRKILFALDHHDMWQSPALISCCSSVWADIEDDCKWNLDVFIQKHIVDRLHDLIAPFELLVSVAQILPMLLIPNKKECFVTSCPCREETFGSQTPKTKQVLVATSFDGAYGAKVDPLPPLEPKLCISERTWAGFTKDIKVVAQKMPLYIRGNGEPGDVFASANFKATMIKQFGVTHFLESDAQQIEIIQQLCPDLVICQTI